MYFFILIVGRSDAEDSFYKALTAMDDVRVEFAPDWTSAREVLEGDSPDVVILDGSIVQKEGISLVSSVRSLKENMKVYVVAKCPTVEMAVGSIKNGADDFLTYPPDLVKLRLILKEEVEAWRLRSVGQGFFHKQRAKYDFSNIIGESEAIREVFGMIKKIIPSRRATVLIRGETGTGKGLFARAIHYNSMNGKGRGDESPFVEINCTAIPENLLESELFGYEKGAFTDAKASKKGLFELADGGTIFLDEIGHMNHNLQVKLLKVVEEKNFRRLGGTTNIRVDLRIIAGTNKDLETAIEMGQFREDLYYRLNVFTINLPLLRDRGNDVLLLAQHFLDQYAREHHRMIEGFTGDAVDLMMSYEWPGNVRELKNAIERAVLMEEGDRISAESLPIHDGSRNLERIEGVRPSGPSSSASDILLELGGVGIPLEAIEKKVVERVLRLNGGNRSRTARVLRISRPRLLRMIRKYGIEP